MIRKVRKSKVTKDEIIADLIFFSISAVVSFLFIFFFDIHWSFYEAPIFPLKFVFQSTTPYIIGSLLGGLIGFFLIKLFLFGLKEEEKANHKL
jgi:hypothetical protein